MPSIRAGAAKRMTCHSGKFHGMTASTTPNGSYRTYDLAADVVTGWSARSCSALPANQRSPAAHLETSALAAAKVLPISVVRIRARSGTSASSSSAAVIRCRARSAYVVVR